MNKLSQIKKFLKEKYLIVLIFFAILAGIISIYIGVNQSVWFDEAYSISLAKKSISEIINLTAVDVHPPVYYILLHFWGNIFGWGEIALRSLSALFLSLAIFIGGLVTKKTFGVRSLYFVLPIFCLSPILLRYGFEIRMYSLAILIGILATYILVLARQKIAKKEQYIFYGIYAILVALGMYVLYYLALLWIAHLCWLIYVSFKNKEPVKKSKWIFAYILSVVFFLPWISIFFKQMTGGALAPISQAMTIENLIGVISFNFLYRPVWQLGAIFAIIVVFVLVAISYASIKTFQKISKKEKDHLLLFALYFIAPIITLTFIGLIKPSYTERYLSHIAIGGLIYLGIILSVASRGKNRIKKILAILLITIFCFGLFKLNQVGNYNFQRLQKPEVKQIAESLTYCDDNKIIFAADPYVAIELGYYINSCNIYFYGTSEVYGGGYATLSHSNFRIEDPETQLSTKDIIYFVHYGDAKLVMPEDYVKIVEETKGGLTVEEYISKNYQYSVE